MAKYAAKVTVYLQIESDYPDGVGEAAHEVGSLMDLIKKGDTDATVYIAHATDIEILNGRLEERMTECDMGLWYYEKGIHDSELVTCLDDGMR